MIGGSLRTRLSLTGAVLVAAGLGTALALGAGNDAGPPSIDADSGTALFALDGMLPGDPPVERCVAIQAIGGSASRLAVSAAVEGVLAQRPAHGGRRRPGARARGCAFVCRLRPRA